MLFRTRILTSVGAALGSAMCWDRELVIQAGLAPGLYGPLGLVLCRPVPPPHSRHWALHEGRGYDCSMRLHLREWGKGQGKGVAILVGGIYLHVSKAIICYSQMLGAPICPFIPCATLPHPALCPSRLPSLDRVSWLPCSQASGRVCSIGELNRRPQGRRRGRVGT